VKTCLTLIQFWNTHAPPEEVHTIVKWAVDVEIQSVKDVQHAIRERMKENGLDEKQSMALAQLPLPHMIHLIKRIANIVAVQHLSPKIYTDLGELPPELAWFHNISLTEKNNFFEKRSVTDYDGKSTVTKQQALDFDL